ncbi:MAG: ABC transporter permease [Thermomicrobiales bacterium]|nr:ABC transporter permease [Thermomicrobiales bacterium]
MCAAESPLTDISVLAEQETAPPYASRSPLAESWRSLKRNRGALIGLLVVLCYLIVGIVGQIAFRNPGILPHDYATQDLMGTFQKPGATGHLLGTDQLGRDMLSRLVVGIGISLAVGFGVTAISMVIGLLAGSIAGFRPGWPDTIISAIIEITWGFPLILIAIIIAGALGPGLTSIVLAIALINWAGFARLIRGEVMVLRNQEFVQAARATGVGDWRILRRHILPHTVAPALVMASYYVAAAIIAEAAFSFIGLGAQPPTPSLGAMIADGRNYILLDHWISTIPGLTIVLIVVALNLLGDGLRDMFDPRLRNR